VVTTGADVAASGNLFARHDDGGENRITVDYRNF
jgi:hypothetical protein